MLSKDIYDLNKLEKVCLEHYENICFISPDIKELKNLLEFHLSYNPVFELPDEINDLKHLEILNLSHNNFKSFPIKLNLSTLKILNLSYNHITIITPNIKNLKQLETLILSNNAIEILPQEFGELENLLDLFLHTNNISIFPEEICKIKSLEILYLSNNKIKEISTSIQNLQNLENFYIDDNQLTYITNNIILCRKLLIFEFHNNQINYKSPQINRFLNRIDKMNTYLFLYNNHIDNIDYDNDLIIRSLIISNKQLKFNKKKLIDEIIDDPILTSNCKLLLFKYSNNYTYHPLLFIRFIEFLYYIWDDITQEGKIKLNKKIKPHLDFNQSLEALL
jgi:Leucine-rich repeat (LRR) protein